jgi:DNA-binding transcriptional regulator PaaX
VQRAWNLNQLAQGYVEFLATYQPVLTELQTRVANAWSR